jgi:hypothetical protein
LQSVVLILEFEILFAKSRTMRRLAFLLLCLSSFAGCHSANQRAGISTDPERVESVDTMHAAEAEAHRQLDNW